MEQQPSRMGRWISGVSAIGLPIIVALLSLYFTQPPRPVPATAPATKFSAERALEQSRRFAVEPRPAGTPALEWARDYLVSRLREIGWETQVQETTMAYPVGEGGNAAPEQWASSPQPSPPPASAKLPPTS